MFRNLFRSGRGRGEGSNRGRGQGLGRGNKPGSGPSGECVCPKCGYQMTHQVGQRCMDLPCPKCNTMMVRK
jgi:hypothetical protein